MHLVSRALVRMRAVLFGPPDSGHAPHQPATAPGASLNHPSPETWTAFPSGTPRRRARCPWPGTELPEITADDIASTLVGAYVLTAEARQQLRQARQFAEVS
ncbi:hypothetical protein OG241_36465 [Streptomyces sp. NBC_01390]|uniref:hypothetical protein n=1 Tax=Streptomyces sp. NBC_01390 TaxID=2903850 RepID=UPI00324D7225